MGYLLALAPSSFLDLLPLLFCAWVCLSAVVGGMLCKSDKPSIIIIIIMGYRSLEWNWPKEAMNRPIWASIVDGAKLF